LNKEKSSSSHVEEGDSKPHPYYNLNFKSRGVLSDKGIILSPPRDDEIKNNSSEEDFGPTSLTINTKAFGEAEQH